MPSTTDRVTRLTRPVAVVSATAAWVVSAVVNGLSGWPLAGTLAGGAVLTALAVGLPMLAERRTAARAATVEQVAEDSAVRMRLVLNDALEPLAYLVGSITDSRRTSSPEKVAQLQGEAKTDVLVASAKVLGADRLRSCFFALTDGRLVPAGFHGRSEAPRTTFEPGTPLGDYALDMLRRRDDLFCADVGTGAPPGWQPGGHGYRTFIAVPVATEKRAFGLMTIDGLAVGDLTEDDIVPARVFARLLAIALNA